jgi:cyclopropane fatty-acyl-phospholipid synthase-like methyltransferase
MILLVQIFLLIIVLIVIFWQASLIFAQILGAPSVYANDKAMIDSFELAGLKKDQLVIDLGCGNGKSLILATKKFGARGIGVERSPYCYLLAKSKVYFSGQSKKIDIFYGDFKKVEKELKNADIVYVYLLNSVLSKIEKWLFQNISEKTKVVSLAFVFPNKKEVGKTETTNLGRQTFARIYSR